MSLRKLVVNIFFLSIVMSYCFHRCYGQQLFYSDILYGGVTGNGGTFGLGSGVVTINLDIPPNSTIKKAYLIAARDSGMGVSSTVILNGINYTFSDETIVTNGFSSILSSSVNYNNSSIHSIEITSDIDSSVNTYNLFIPFPPNLGQSGFFGHFYLYVTFENLNFPIISQNLFFNNQNVSPFSLYVLHSLNKINNLQPVGLELLTRHFCDTIQDGSFVDVNNNTIGLLGGDDLNSSMVTCASPYSNFAHYNDSLFGLDDDTPDSLMAGTDALADIKSYVNNGDTAVDVTFTYQSTWRPFTNPIAALMLSYSTPCDTFITKASATQDTICKGDSVQLNATGGATYSWFGVPIAIGSGLSDTSSANPIATPSQTTTYIVTIKNDSGCVKTEHVKIWVRPEPIPDTIIISPQICGNQDGSITVGTIPQGTPPFTLVLTNLTTSTIEPQTTNLLSGNYQLTITDNNGCTWQSDTLFVPQINNVTANFNNIPQAPFSNPTQPLGKAPMEVSFFNTSQNANNFSWVAISDSGDSLCEIPAFAGMTAQAGMECFFTQGGTYEVCLIAYNNQPQCADTVCKTIFIDNNENVSVFIPNVFTPNGDNENDNFVIQLIGAELLESLDVEVFNRWGQEVGRWKMEVGSEIPASAGMTELVVWNGTTTAGNKASEGTYFYVVTYTTKAGETVTQKGTISLLR